MKYVKKETLAEITMDDVIASWLKDEWYYSVYDKKRNIAINKIVVSPDTNNLNQNKIRKNLLYINRKKALDQIPKNTKWYMSEITKSDLDRCFLINTAWCRELTDGSCKITPLIQKLDSKLVGKENEHVEKIKEIKNKTSIKSISETVLILAGTDFKSAFTIIEGNHRAIGILSKLHELEKDIPIKIILGINIEFKNSPIYMNEVLTKYHNNLKK